MDDTGEMGKKRRDVGRRCVGERVYVADEEGVAVDDLCCFAGSGHRKGGCEFREG